MIDGWVNRTKADTANADMGRKQTNHQQELIEIAFITAQKSSREKKNLNTMRMHGWADLRRSGLARFGLFRDLDWTGYFLDSAVTICIQVVFVWFFSPSQKRRIKKQNKRETPYEDKMGSQKEEEDEDDEDADEDVEKGIKDKELNRPRDPTLTDCGILL